MFTARFVFSPVLSCVIFLMNFSRWSSELFLTIRRGLKLQKVENPCVRYVSSGKMWDMT